MPPPANARGVTRQGGTAILWKHQIGKVSVQRGPDHRAIALRTADFLVVCGYGPADRVAIDWIDETLEFADKAGSPEKPKVVIGDLNWRQAYRRCLADEWIDADHECRHPAYKSAQ